jgi:SAM-dependent methyltransferase
MRDLMDISELQRQWDAFGRLDPFWAVLTDPQRRGRRWDPAEFFETGRRDVAMLLEHAARLGVPRQWRQALDFGCGAGRLTQALATHVERAIGVDIAPSMIALAREHNAHGDRCLFEVNDRPDLSRFADAAFDIVHTGRVLQHMEPRLAEGYIRELVRVLAPGGYLSFDMPSEHGLFDASGIARPLSAYRASIEVLAAPPRLVPGERHVILVGVQNAGTSTWANASLNAGNHWLLGESVVVRDDGREAIPQPWHPGTLRRVPVIVTAPREPATYRLQFDVVEEGLTWFGDLGSPVGEIGLTVTGASEAEAAVAASEPAAAAPQMGMHAIPRARVEALLAESGARLLDVGRVHHCGPTWLAFQYHCSR